MDRFTYKAKDTAGKLVKGEVEASTKQLAAKLLRERSLIVISIKKSAPSILGFFGKKKTRVKPADVATFTRQFATMINAGLPITEALSILHSQSRANLQPVLSQMLTDIQGGENFSTALGKFPSVFSKTYIALIKSGETGGVIDKVIDRLADNMEKQEEFKGKVKGALIYPAIIIAGMFIVGAIMMIFVIPRLSTLYDEFDAELPLPTRILIGISTFSVKFWPLLVVLGIGGYYAFIQYRKTKHGRYVTDGLILRAPIFGELQKQIILAELTRTLALMIASGVSIIEGLNIGAGVVKNSVISEALVDATKQIEKGFPIAYSFAKHPEAFPFVLSQMVAVGEETGKMDEVLGKVAKVFETESDQKVKTLTAAIEPLVMILLGLGVGFLVIAIILPIYNLTSQF